MPHGAKPGHQRYAGRAKGTKNKATIERELLAADIAKRQMSRAHETGRELAVEALERYQKLFEGVASHFRPNTDEELEALAAQNKKGNPHADFDKFKEWLCEARDTAKMLAEYQSPKLRAIAIAPTPIGNEERTKTFTLTVFEGGRALTPPVVDVTPSKKNGGGE